MQFRKSSVAEGSSLFGALDGLRLLASANIVLFHLVASGALYPLASDGWLFMAQKAPLFNSSLFFLLAGFLYQFKFGTRGSPLVPASFLKGRLRRLYPLHAITVLLMVVFTWARIPAARDPEHMLLSALHHLSLLWAWAPFGSFSLNEPSWAIGAFLFCYAIMPPFVKAIQAESKGSRLVLALIIVAIMPLLWTFSYKTSAYPGSNDDVFLFHHVFPPSRFFEFLAGMLLARLRSLPLQPHMPDWSFDLGIALILFAQWKGHHLMWRPNIEWPWMQYHVFSLWASCFFVWALSFGQGYIARLLSWKPVRIMGRAGFYPYLLHIPAFALCGIVIEDTFHKPGWLRQPLAIMAFFIVLYGLSTWFDQRLGHASKTKKA